MSEFHLLAHYHQQVMECISVLQKKKVLPEDINTQSVTLEAPKDESHGDLSTNAAMVLAKPARKNPREIAVLMVAELEKIDDITSVTIAGPGFINLTLDNGVWQGVIPEINQAGSHYGDSVIGAGEAVNVEYVSANPTGPLHIGHARNAVYGDALSALLEKAGYNVTREYYINDAGAQIITLARSVYLRYQEALGENIDAIPEGLYPGDYLVPVGKALAEIYGSKFKESPEEEWLPVFKQKAIEAMITLIKDDLHQLGVNHKVFTSELAIQSAGMIEESFDMLNEGGQLYQGVLEPPKGKVPEDWEPREQTLFRSTDHGDDVDRPLVKSDGSYTYFASDIAYHLDKYRRGFKNMVIVLGADHGGYVKRLKAAVSAVSGGTATIDCKITQMVNFLDNGVPVKMSKRAGTFTTVRDVVDAVGSDVIRFIMLTRKNDVLLDFDLAKVKEKSRDNPVFYVQYAHARAQSVLRHASEEIPDVVKSVDNISKSQLALLDDVDEIKLIKLLAFWPKTVEQAAVHNEPHRIAFYLQEVAAQFHSLWNKGKGDTQLRFIDVTMPDCTIARLSLIKALTNVIASGLLLFNVEPSDSM